MYHVAVVGLGRRGGGGGGRGGCWKEKECSRLVRHVSRRVRRGEWATP